MTTPRTFDDLQREIFVETVRNVGFRIDDISLARIRAALEKPEASA